jgi:hypothetical protein
VAREIDRIKDERTRMRARDVALIAITEVLHPSPVVPGRKKPEHVVRSAKVIQLFPG